MPNPENLFIEQPSVDTIRSQLQRISASPEFQVPDRTRRFLHFIVEETLAGRGHRIKGYTIATEVFGRSETFDAQSDPVVRLEAGRLRRAIERYYLVSGQDDPVLIEIPKGCYVPTFATRAGASDTQSLPVKAEAMDLHSDSAARPRSNRAVVSLWALAILSVVAFAVWLVAQDPMRRSLGYQSVLLDTTLVVVPFTHLGGDQAQLLATGLTEDLIARLASLDEVKLLGSETTRSIKSNADMIGLNGNAAARFLLKGNVQASQNRVRLRARLLDAVSGRVVWSQTFDRLLDSNRCSQATALSGAGA